MSVLKFLGGRKALVTGAGSGIGKGIEVALAEADAEVVINYVGNESAANEVVHDIRRYGTALRLVR